VYKKAPSRRYINEAKCDFFYPLEIKKIWNKYSMKFIGFAIADSMFDGDCVIRRKTLNVEDVRRISAGDCSSCCNPSHTATINAIKSRYGISVPVPETPPRVKLGRGDSVIVIGVRGLPRLTDRHEYSDEEVAKATFEFSEYTVVE